MYPRYLYLICFVVSLSVRQYADGQDRAAVKANLDQIRTAIEKYDQAKSFPIMPWDQMRGIDGPEDQVHGLASLVECNFTYAGFPRVADLAACEKLGLRAIVYPADSLGLTKPAHLSDEQIDKAVRTLAEQTKGSPACVGYYLRDEPGLHNLPIWGRSWRLFVGMRRANSPTSICCQATQQPENRANRSSRPRVLRSISSGTWPR